MDIKCPITNQILYQPILASDGFFYEKEAIERWLIKNKASPLTKQHINQDLYKCIELKNYIETYLNENPHKRSKQYMPVISVEYIDNMDIIHDYLGSNQFEKLLLYKNFDLTKMYYYFDFFTEYCTNLDTIKYVLDNAIDLECIVEHKRRLIHTACYYNNLEMVKYLIDKNVDLEYEDNYKLRPIHLACENNNIEMVKCLIDKKVNLDCEDNYMRRPIHIACLKNNLDMIKYIINTKKVNLECETISKWRPIHHVSRCSDIDTIMYFVDIGVNLECKTRFITSEKYTPIELLQFNNKLSNDEKQQLTQYMTNKILKN
ncbi:MAG: hypothetical protein Homavirus39_2 [Homavirus sp.]|uniref:U-box domain-containing protein n=1 Tax=Homavirus sp. TaxID=2487769 RepID=A0A3G5A793_9VIRU|nr:MAG: hypothetical protein Homavirus39_2 [Homavirus sp.]